MTTAAQAQATETTTAPEAAAPAPKELSKMDKCKVIYDEVFAPGYDLKGKSQRAVFIARVMDELKSSKNLANTYYQNISNLRRGKGLYKYNKYESKAGASKTETGKPESAKEEGLDLPGGNVTKTTLANAEASAKEVIRDMSQRWQLKDDKGTVINTFSSRAKAKAAADEAGEGFSWADRDAK